MKKRKKKAKGFGSSEFLTPTLVGAGVGASLGFLAPPLSVQGAVAGASIGAWIGSKRAGMRKKILHKMEHNRVTKFMGKISKATASKDTSKMNLKKHTITGKKWTPLERKIMKMVGSK